MEGHPAARGAVRQQGVGRGLRARPQVGPHIARRQAQHAAAAGPDGCVGGDQRAQDLARREFGALAVVGELVVQPARSGLAAIGLRLCLQHLAQAREQGSAALQPHQRVGGAGLEHGAQRGGVQALERQRVHAQRVGRVGREDPGHEGPEACHAQAFGAGEAGALGPLRPLRPLVLLAPLAWLGLPGLPGLSWGGLLRCRVSRRRGLRAGVRCVGGGPFGCDFGCDFGGVLRLAGTRGRAQHGQQVLALLPVHRQRQGVQLRALGVAPLRPGPGVQQHAHHREVDARARHCSRGAARQQRVELALAVHPARLEVAPAAVVRNLQVRKALARERRHALRQGGQGTAVQLEVARAAFLHRTGHGRTACADGGALAQRGQGVTEAHMECTQFSTCRSGTRSNSRPLLVTNTQPCARACAAIQRSLPPITHPRCCKSARIWP